MRLVPNAINVEQIVLELRMWAPILIHLNPKETGLNGAADEDEDGAADEDEDEDEDAADEIGRKVAPEWTKQQQRE